MLLRRFPFAQTVARVHRSFPVLLLLAGCSTSTTDAALKVTVHFGTTPAQCAQVNVAGKNMTLSSSTPLMRGNSDLVVGILETPDLGAVVDVQAVGFAAGDCTGAQDDEGGKGRCEELPRRHCCS